MITAGSNRSRAGLALLHSKPHPAADPAFTTAGTIHPGVGSKGVKRQAPTIEAEPEKKGPYDCGAVGEAVPENPLVWPSMNGSKTSGSWRSGKGDKREGKGEGKEAALHHGSDPDPAKKTKTLRERGELRGYWEGEGGRRRSSAGHDS
jgi:hypothetical protein